MSGVRRISLLVLVWGALLALAVPALATDETTPTTSPTEPSVAEQEELEATQGPQPVITAPSPESAEGPDDWTYRYLIPTLIALAVLVVVVTTIQYFTQVVRKRYKVVE